MKRTTLVDSRVDVMLKKPAPAEYDVEEPLPNPLPHDAELSEEAGDEAAVEAEMLDASADEEASEGNDDLREASTDIEPSQSDTSCRSVACISVAQYSSSRPDIEQKKSPLEPSARTAIPTNIAGSGPASTTTTGNTALPESWSRTISYPSVTFACVKARAN